MRPHSPAPVAPHARSTRTLDRPGICNGGTTLEKRVYGDTRDAVLGGGEIEREAVDGGSETIKPGRSGTVKRGEIGRILSQYFSAPLLKETSPLNAQQATLTFTENAAQDVNTTSTIQESDTPAGNTPDEQERSPANRDQDEESDTSGDSAFEQTSESEDDMEEEVEKHTPLTYQIAPEVLNAALEAPPNTSGSYWSQKMYRGPNDEKISTHYCENLEVSERVAKYFANETVLGFDIEWKPNPIPTFIKQNASLIQIASEDRIALFHVALFKGSTPNQLVPPTLKKILESPDILKVGVAIKADFTRLEKFLGIKARRVMELSRTHNLIEAEDRSRAGHKLVGLATQVRQHLLLPLYKGEPMADDIEPEDELEWIVWKKRQRVRESDWSKRLDVHQIHYAAADAYAGFRLYDVLESKRKQLQPIPPLPRLCDDDPPTKTALSKKKAMAAKILQDDQAKVVVEALTGLSAEVAEEEDTQDTQGYQTALEEVRTENEMEESEWSASETSEEVEEEDADYTPKRTPRETTSSDPTPTTSTRHVGRLNLSKLAEANPGYPTLPNLSDADDGSDSSDAFEPLPTVRSDRRTTTEVPALPTSEEVEDEFADLELEEALMNLDIDDLAQEVMVTLTSTSKFESVNRNIEDTVHEAVPASAPTSELAPTPESEPMDRDIVNTLQEAVPAPTSAPEPVSENTQNDNNPFPPDTFTSTPQYMQATTWAKDYLESTIPLPSQTLAQQEPSRVRATLPHLRAYYLWHHQNVPVEEIGALLRDPPLPNSTMASHILQAVTLEGLPFENQKVRTVLEGLGDRGRARWANLWKTIE